MIILGGYIVVPPESVVDAGLGSASGGMMLQSSTSARNVKSSTATHPLLMSPLMAVNMIYLKCAIFREPMIDMRFQ